MIKWLTYVYMQALLLRWGQSGNSANLVAGAVAGAVAATAVTPADVIKTRLQVAQSKSATQMSICRELVAEGGVPAFFRGLGPRLMRIPLYTSITLATFDFVKELFTTINEHALKPEL